MATSVGQRRARGRPRNSPDEAPQGTVQALDRSLYLLRTLAKTGSATLTDLALAAGIPASTAHRILATLQKHDFVAFDSTTQEWTIGVETFRVGSAFVQRTNVVDASRDVMRQLADDLGETANLGLCHSGAVVFIAQAEGHNPIRAFFRPGTRGPLHASGIGKALLATMPRHEVMAHLKSEGLPAFTPKTLTAPSDLFAELEAIRSRGYAFDDEERYLGMRCVAAPVFNTFGEAVAGLSVSGPTVRFPDEGMAEVGARIRRAALAVTDRIGGMAPTAAALDA
ncbi:MAG: IclR family transcriptional regulator [Devosia sp.]